MSAHRGAAVVRAIAQSSSGLFRPEDFEPRAVPKVGTWERSKELVLEEELGSEWTAPSTSVSLGVMHETLRNKAKHSKEGWDKLSFIRQSASMVHDGHDADLFETENVRGTGPRSSIRTFMVECKHCRRTCLATRFLEHLRVCPKFEQKDSAVLTASHAELSLVIAPYVHMERIPDRGVTVEQNPDDVTVNIVTLPYFSGDVSAIRKRGSHRLKRLTPLAPIRKARGGRRPREEPLALVPFRAITPPKKKQTTPEKRAISSAQSTGLGSTDSEDKLAFASGSWGAAAQWTKLVQFCRPIVVPRSELRKNALNRETPLSLFTKASNGSSQLMFADTVNSKMVPRGNNERITKALSRPLPSLPGALMHLRGKYFNNLQGTDLGRVEISSNSIPKTIYMYHGQSFFATPGQFISDPRTKSDITLPQSTVDVAGAAASRGAAANGVNQQQNLAAQKAAAVNGSAPSTPQEPAPKKQRVSKARSNANSTNSGHPPKQPTGTQRKTPQQRGAQNAAVPVNQKQMNARMQAQMTQQHRHAMNIGANANVPVAAMQRNQQQMAQVKKQHYRSPAVSAIPPSAISPGALNPTQLAANKLAASTAMKAARGNAMVHANTQQAQNMLRAAGMFHPNATKLNANVNNPHGSAGALPVDYESLLRNTSVGTVQSPVPFNQQEFATMLANPKQAASHASSTSRPQHQQKMGMDRQMQAQQAHAQAQAQAQVQAQTLAHAQMASLTAAQQAHLRNFNRKVVAGGVRRMNTAQARQPVVASSSALSGRSGVSGGGGVNSGTQMYSTQQLTNGMNGVANMFNTAFAGTHDASGNAQGITPQAANAANLAYMQMMHNNAAAAGGAMGAQMAPAAGGNMARAGAVNGMQNLRALQQFGAGMGVQGNMLNFFQNQDGSGNPAMTSANMAALAAARMGSRNMGGAAGAAGIMPEQIYTNLMNAPGNQMMGAAPVVNTPGTPSTSQARNTAGVTPNASAALDAIDQALSLSK